MRPTAITVTRLLTAAATAGTGYVHASLYLNQGYRAIPTIGPAFLLLSSSSFAIAALLLAGSSPVLRLGAVGVAAGALVGFVMSRTTGVAGFTERGLQPAPQALISLITELGALTLLVAWEVMLRRSPASLPAPARAAVLPGNVKGRPGWAVPSPHKATEAEKQGWPARRLVGFRPGGLPAPGCRPAVPPGVLGQVCSGAPEGVADNGVGGVDPQCYGGRLRVLLVAGCPEELHGRGACLEQEGLCGLGAAFHGGAEDVAVAADPEELHAGRTVDDLDGVLRGRSSLRGSVSAGVASIAAAARTPRAGPAHARR
jgi:hypothetical protein